MTTGSHAPAVLYSLYQDCPGTYQAAEKKVGGTLAVVDPGDYETFAGWGGGPTTKHPGRKTRPSVDKGPPIDRFFGVLSAPQFVEDHTRLRGQRTAHRTQLTRVVYFS